MDGPLSYVRLLALFLAFSLHGNVCKDNLAMAGCGQVSRWSSDIVYESLQDELAGTRSDWLNSRLLQSFSPGFSGLTGSKLIAGCYLTGPAYSGEIDRLLPFESSPYLVVILPQDQDGSPDNGPGASEPMEFESTLSERNYLCTDFNKIAHAALINDPTWRQVQSDAGDLDGVFIPLHVSFSTRDSISASLEKDIFDDPYWTYYADVDQWGVVLNIDGNKLKQSIASRESDRSDRSRARHTVRAAKSNSLPTIVTSGYRKSIVAESANSRSRLESVFSRFKYGAIQLLKNSTSTIQQIVIRVRLWLELSDLKPLLDKIRFNVAHRGIGTGEASAASAGGKIVQTNPETCRVLRPQATGTFVDLGVFRLSQCFGRSSVFATAVLDRIRRVIRRVSSITSLRLDQPNRQFGAAEVY